MSKYDIGDIRQRLVDFSGSISDDEKLDLEEKLPEPILAVLAEELGGCVVDGPMGPVISFPNGYIRIEGTLALCYCFDDSEEFVSELQLYRTIDLTDPNSIDQLHGTA